jgi:hypothetical protein
MARSIFAKDLSLTLQVTPHTVKLGDRVVFTFVYTNNSNREIGLSPEYRVYQANDLRFTRLDTGEVGFILPVL